jgi:hypothetical protein
MKETFCWRQDREQNLVLHHTAKLRRKRNVYRPQSGERQSGNVQSTSQFPISTSFVVFSCLENCAQDCVHAGYRLTFYKTRFAELVFANLGRGEWSFFNPDESGDPRRVGLIYHSKIELLADLYRLTLILWVLTVLNRASDLVARSNSK